MKRDYQPRPDNCRGCDRPFRPSRAILADNPGTVQHRAGGYCAPCLRSYERYGVTDVGIDKPLSVRLMERLKHEHPTAYAFHIERRRRGIPAGGLKVRGER